MLDWADELIEPWCIKAIKPSFFQERDYPLTKLAAKVMNPERKLRSVKRLHRPLSSRQWNKKKYNRDVSDDETNVKQHESDFQVQTTDKELRIHLDLHQYRPEEVKITSDNQKITIKATHEEKNDNSSVCYEMTRSFTLPENVDFKSALSTMNSDGQLSITISRSNKETLDEVPIQVEFKE
ncbi:heat shock protein hsp-16.2-like isoform X2 [Biomphalaria glabrata]|nr:heat shock protein hsp-16.2-like isoform X2 [Biomphalaria glabrata]XP_055892939.1 heat shock protein hsp-16.2-like isoform X2 [Biomphalaria glabrata]